MRKNVSIGTRPSAAGKTTDPESWVQDRGAGQGAPAAKPPVKRLTIDLPAELHAKLKAQCAMRGVKMVDEIRTILQEKLK